MTNKGRALEMYLIADIFILDWTLKSYDQLLWFIYEKETNYSFIEWHLKRHGRCRYRVIFSSGRQFSKTEDKITNLFRVNLTKNNIFLAWNAREDFLSFWQTFLWVIVVARKFGKSEFLSVNKNFCYFNSQLLNPHRANYVGKWL